jgi:hypothetical protein
MDSTKLDAAWRLLGHFWTWYLEICARPIVAGAPRPRTIATSQGRIAMTNLDRRNLIGALAAGGAAMVAAATAKAGPAELKLTDLRKEAEVSCLYHCDFADEKRYDALLRNIHNHLSVYNFDPLSTKIVIVAHGPGIRYHLKDVADTPWEKLPPLDPDLEKRLKGLGQYGVEVYLCKITFQRMKIDLGRVKDEPYIRIVPSGVATVAALQSKGFAYLKVG